MAFIPKFFILILVANKAVHGNPNPGIFDSVVHGVAEGMGTIENSVSPSAMRAFCHQNGYTVWVGEGPEPVPEGIIGNAWSAWGSLTGAGWGAITPDSGLKGKCDAAGWAKPGAAGTTTTTTVSGGSNPGGYIQISGSQPSYGGIDSGYDITQGNPNPSYIQISQPNPNPSYIQISQPNPNPQPNYVQISQPNPNTGYVSVTQPNPNQGYVSVTQQNPNSGYVSVSQPKTTPGYIQISQPSSNPGSKITYGGGSPGGTSITKITGSNPQQCSCPCK